MEFLSKLKIIGIKVLEVLEIFMLLLLFLFFIIYAILSILTGLFDTCDNAFERFSSVLRIYTQNWESLLTIFVLLFFRPIQNFLLNLKKIGSAERESAEDHPTKGIEKLTPYASKDLK